MIAVVTLEQARLRLRIDTTDGDADLQLMIDSATDIVIRHLKGAPLYEQELDGDGKPVVDGDGNPVYTEEFVPAIVNAILLLIGYLNKDRDNDKDHEWDENSLPRPIRAILNPLRDPALA
ncbi:hypothetical protein J2W30_003699 [Variovorax boronicumulans]|uniref:head-tail connector protein n=1 Tax=Variovorax boronicumulans TaxID=436515 RepID=UPI00278B9CDD|nr:head-tail connector protein [Variovorax boronicumulans]MDQ0035926.1 hypothetical protein [Variovorax boronicumulans]